MKGTIALVPTLLATVPSGKSKRGSLLGRRSCTAVTDSTLEPGEVSSAQGLGFSNRTGASGSG